jgi:hypothetical protein
MLNESEFDFGEHNQKIAHDLIMGKSREEIAKELVKKVYPFLDPDDPETIDHICAKIYNFEQHLLGGSKFLSKNGKFFREILSKYKSTTQGRELLRKAYKKQIVGGLKSTLICISIFVACYIVKHIIGRNYRLELFGGFVGLFGAVTSILWALIGFTRWYRVRH